MNEPFDTNDVIHIRPSRWIRVLATLDFVSTTAFLIGMATGSNLLVLLFVIMGLIGYTNAMIKNLPPRRVKVMARATGAGIQIGDAAVSPFLPRSQIANGVILPSNTVAPRVRLTLRHGFTRLIELEVRDEGEGRRLLRTLGLDVLQTVESFRVLPWVFATRLWFSINRGLLPAWSAGALIMSLVFKLNWLMVLGWVVLPVALLDRLLGLLRFLLEQQSWIEVGTDGVLIRWLWQKRFIAYSEIAAVEPYEKSGWSDIGLLLLRRSGEQVRLLVTYFNTDEYQVKMGKESVALIQERIREAMECYQQGEAVALAMLHSRKERSIGDWITSLRSIGAGASTTHRVAPVAPERLWRIVEAPSAQPMARAAAAVALGSRIDEDGRARLKAVADATVAPKLRVALAAATSSTEDAALMEALAELDAAESAAASIKAG